MNSSRCFTWALAGLFVVAAGATRAAEPKQIVKADNAQDFAVVATAVRQEMQTGGRYEFTPEAERGTIDARLADMSALFDKRGTVDAMTADEKVRLMNDQSQINTILTKRDNDRLICRREAPTGSHLTRSVCRTYGEIERSQRDSTQYLEDRKMQATMNRRGG